MLSYLLTWQAALALLLIAFLIYTRFCITTAIIYLKGGQKIRLILRGLKTTRNTTNNALTKFVWETHRLAGNKLHTITLDDVSAIVIRRGL